MTRPITDLGDFQATEVKNLQWVGRPASGHSDPLNLLLLSDGFSEADANLFLTFSETLTEKFLTIAPFSFVSDYINIFACFTPSKESRLQIVESVADVSTDLWRNVFGAFIVKSPRTSQPGTWVYNISFQSFTGERVNSLLKALAFPSDFTASPAVNTAERIWGDRTSKSFGAVCIICNTDGIAELAQVSIIGGVQHEQPRVGWFGVSMQGYNAPNTELQEGYQHSLAHELAHVLFLSDEYEHPGPLKQSFDPESGDPALNPGQNIIAPTPATIDGVIAEIEREGGWGALLTARELSEVRSGERIFSRERLFAGRALPGGMASMDDVDTTAYPNHPITGNPLKYSDFYVVEGATYRRKVYRPNFECRMRLSKFDSRIQGDYRAYKVPLPDGKFAYGAPRFCRFCDTTIRRVIAGTKEFGIGSKSRSRIERLFYDVAMPRLNRSFVDTPFSSTNRNCEIASARVVMVLQQYCTKTNFGINGGHVWVESDGLILDATFFDFYTESSGAEVIKYRNSEGQEFEFDPLYVKRGLAGTLAELQTYMANRIPVAGSLAQLKIPGALLPEATADLIAVLYEDLRGAGLSNYTVRWAGPGNDFPSNVSALTSYRDEILDQFQLWNDYRTGRDPNSSLRFLDKSVPLSD
jgi:hypothetical protein